MRNALANSVRAFDSVSDLACEGDVGSLWYHLGGCGFTLESFWGHFRHIRLKVAASLWRHFAITLKLRWVALWSLRGPFGVTLGSVLAYEGVFDSVWHHFAIIVESLWVYDGPLSKNNHFPHRFQWLYSPGLWPNGVLDLQ